MKAKPEAEHPVDIVTGRLGMAKGINSAVMSSWDDDAAQFTMPKEDMYYALWAVDHLLTEAQHAAGGMIGLTKQRRGG